MFKFMYSYLHDHPHLGIVSGIVGGVIVWIRNIFTDDQTLKIVGGIAAWAGCLVAVLTLVVWSIRLIDTIKARRKPK